LHNYIIYTKLSLITSKMKYVNIARMSVNRTLTSTVTVMTVITEQIRTCTVTRDKQQYTSNIM